MNNTSTKYHCLETRLTLVLVLLFLELEMPDKHLHQFNWNPIGSHEHWYDKTDFRVDHKLLKDSNQYVSSYSD